MLYVLSVKSNDFEKRYLLCNYRYQKCIYRTNRVFTYRASYLLKIPWNSFSWSVVHIIITRVYNTKPSARLIL